MLEQQTLHVLWYVSSIKNWFSQKKASADGTWNMKSKENKEIHFKKKNFPPCEKAKTFRVGAKTETIQ